MNAHAQPYFFPKDSNPELAAYLTEKTEHDPAAGCLLWTGGVNKQGEPRVWKTYAAKFGSDRPARLAWQLCHGTGLGKRTKLVPTCGNPRCINPDHLKAPLPAAKARRMGGLPDDEDEDEMPRKNQPCGGVLKVGRRLLNAQRVYQIQSLPPPRDPRLGLRAAFYWEVCWPAPLDAPVSYRQREKLEVIRAVRRCPVRATRTELPSGIIRYDLPAGVTEIAFTELPPPSYEDVFGWGRDDDTLEAAPEVAPAPTAKAA